MKVRAILIEKSYLSSIRINYNYISIGEERIGIVETGEGLEWAKSLISTGEIVILEV